MPTIEENKSSWDGNYNWQNRSDEWSAAWGGAFMQWYGTIFPRIKAHVPINSILEIACGCGRWTQYLKDLCKHLTVIDLSEKCISACKQRFSEFSHIEYHVNDGKSLDMIPDGSTDFIFSFDSLVHVDEFVMEAYLSQFPRILNKDGVAFIHHSNLGEYHTRYSRIRRIPKLEELLTRVGVLDRSLHFRDFSVDAKKVEALAKRHGLRCISQEIVLWGTKKTFIDCMSTIVRHDSPRVVANKIFKNADFMQEACNLLQLSQLYSPDKKQALDYEIKAKLPDRS
jgi:ubiquinone/menaquinone biosynthesis C-methylase UbiE